MTEQPTVYDHAIVMIGSDTEDELLIPLSLKGVVSIFWTRKPTIQEYESCPHYELTADGPEYDPLDGSYAQQEQAMAAWVAQLAKTGDGMPVRQVQSVSASLNHALPESFLYEHCLAVFARTIDSYDTDDYRLTCLLIRCLRIAFHGRETSALKSSLLQMDGFMLTQ